MESVDIYDANGNRLILRNFGAYMEMYDGTVKRVGEGDMMPRKYVGRSSMLWGTFSADEYIFRNIVLLEDRPDDGEMVITVQHTEKGGRLTSTIEYFHFQHSDSLEFRVSPNDSQLFDTVMRSVIEPMRVTLH